jgi:hypothetical protein
VTFYSGITTTPPLVIPEETKPHDLLLRNTGGLISGLIFDDMYKDVERVNKTKISHILIAHQHTKYP